MSQENISKQKVDENQGDDDFEDDFSDDNDDDSKNSGKNLPLAASNSRKASQHNSRQASNENIKNSKGSNESFDDFEDEDNGKENGKSKESFDKSDEHDSGRRVSLSDAKAANEITNSDANSQKSHQSLQRNEDNDSDNRLKLSRRKASDTNLVANAPENSEGQNSARTNRSHQSFQGNDGNVSPHGSARANQSHQSFAGPNAEDRSPQNSSRSNKSHQSFQGSNGNVSPQVSARGNGMVKSPSNESPRQSNEESATQGLKGSIMKLALNINPSENSPQGSARSKQGENSRPGSGRGERASQRSSPRVMTNIQLSNASGQSSARRRNSQTLPPQSPRGAQSLKNSAQNSGQNSARRSSQNSARSTKSNQSTGSQNSPKPVERGINNRRFVTEEVQDGRTLFETAQSMIAKAVVGSGEIEHEHVPEQEHNERAPEPEPEHHSDHYDDHNADPEPQNDADEPDNEESQVHADVNPEQDTIKIYSGPRQNHSYARTELPPPIPLNKLEPLNGENDAESKRLLYMYTKHDRLPPVTKREQVIQYCEREKVNALISCKYEKAAKLQANVRSMIEKMTEEDEKERKKQQLESAEEKLKKLDDDIKQMEKDYKQQRKDEDYKQKERMKQLSIYHNQEYDHFEEHWNDTNFLKMTFARPSPTLLTLLHQERNLLITKDFSRADEVHKRTLELEKQESEEARRNALREREKAQKKVDDKHVTDLAICDQHYRKNLGDIDRKFEQSMKAVTARRLKLEKDIDEMKRPHTSLSRSAPITTSAFSPMTARTTQRYSAFKTERRTPNLTIEPLGKIKRKKVVP